MKKTLLKMLSVFMALVLTLTIVPFSALIAFAQEEPDSPVEITVTSDKTSYSLGSTAVIKVKVKNQSEEDLNNVVIAGYSDKHLLADGTSAVKELASLKKGETAEYSFNVVLNRKTCGAGFFGKIILLFKQLFKSYTSFPEISYDYKSCVCDELELKQGSVNSKIKLNVWYSPIKGDTVVVETNTNESYAEALANLINEQQSSSGFSISEAQNDEYYSKRIIVKGENFDFASYDPDIVIIGPDDTYIVQFSTSSEAESFQNSISKKSNIEYAEPDQYVSLSPLEGSGEFEENSYTSSSYNSWGVKYIEADTYASYLSKSGYTQSITVAVVDTGVDNAHPYLSGKLVSGYDFVDGDSTPYEGAQGTGHGTHVSGTVLDCTPGLNVKIMPVRVLGLTGSGSSSTVAAGIKYAVDNGAKVINMSLGGGHSNTEDDAVSYAVNKGVTVCVAAGNENQNTSNVCPAHITTAGCVCVAAIDSNEAKASFSNYGNAVDVAAPGVSIKSCVPGGAYESWNGTSMATPHVSAVAAMLKLANSSATPAKIEELIKQYTKDLGSSGKDSYYGYGSPKLSKAVPKCTVTYNANGGNVSPTSATVEAGKTVTLPTPTRSGYSCLGWSTNKSATSAEFNCGSVCTVNGNATLYAVWKAIPKYTVTYNANGGNVSPTSVTVEEGKTVTLPTPTRSGYSCLGWSTNKSATSAEFNCGSVCTVNGNATLYAVWKATSKYTVTYNANGGSVSPTSATVESGKTVTLPTPSRTGYTCLGWSTVSYATIASYSCGVSYKPEANITLYAVWKINTYTVTYNANGGNGAPSSSTQDCGVSIPISSYKPTRSGYQFLGWSTSSTATSASYVIGDWFSSYSNTTLYAVWGKASVTLSSYSGSATVNGYRNEEGNRGYPYKLSNGNRGFKFKLPTVYTSNCADGTGSTGWQVVSGSVAGFENGYMYISQPGTVKVKYVYKGYESSVYTFTFKLYKEMTAANAMRSEPSNVSSTSKVLVSIPSGNIDVISVNYNGKYKDPNDGKIYDACYWYVSYGGQKGYIIGWKYWD